MFKNRNITITKLMFAMVFAVVIIFLLIGLVLDINDRFSGKYFCKEKRMTFFKKLPSNYFDINNDVICYKIMPNIDCGSYTDVSECSFNPLNEVELYYFKR